MKQIRECLHCKILTYNVRFCSKNCKTKYYAIVAHNKAAHIIQRTCKKCGAPITHARRILCVDCTYQRSWVGKLLSDYMEAGERTPRFHTKIRDIAHSIYRQADRMTGVCAICQFDVVDLCHIKPVAKFSDHITIEEVNDPDNLLELCPNHHRLLDAGRLSMSQADDGSLNWSILPAH